MSCCVVQNKIIRQNIKCYTTILYYYYFFYRYFFNHEITTSAATAMRNMLKCFQKKNWSAKAKKNGGGVRHKLKKNTTTACSVVRYVNLSPQFPRGWCNTLANKLYFETWCWHKLLLLNMELKWFYEAGLQSYYVSISSWHQAADTLLRHILFFSLCKHPLEEGWANARWAAKLHDTRQIKKYSGKRNLCDKQRMSEMWLLAWERISGCVGFEMMTLSALSPRG